MLCPLSQVQAPQYTTLLLLHLCLQAQALPNTTLHHHLGAPLHQYTTLLHLLQLPHHCQPALVAQPGA